MTGTHTVYIGYGANMGGRRRNIQWALDRLSRTPGIFLEAASPLYETEPVDYEDQDWFLNGAARISTTLPPEGLLEVLQAIEKEAGRTRTGPRFGPRPLDLDILFYDDLLMDSPGLVLPHPRLHKRRFVLTPLCDIASDLRHPALDRTMAQLLQDLNDGGKIVQHQPGDAEQGPDSA